MASLGSITGVKPSFLVFFRLSGAVHDDADGGATKSATSLSLHL